MKKLIYLPLIFFMASRVFCQTSAYEHEWKATVKIVDEAGAPVDKATVKVGYYNKNTSVEIEGISDTNGIFEATHTTSTLNYIEYGLALDVEKTGYYQTLSKCDLGLPYDLSKWNPTIILVLKKIGKPIAMYSKWVNSEPHVFKKTGRPPIVFNRTVGYDMMAGDWVAPYGKGVNTDLSFTEEFNKQSTADFNYKLTVSFPKPGDGIQEFTVPDVENGSDLRSPHEAPTNGYQAQLIRENFRHPGQPGKSDYDDNRKYFFRVRTALDVNGNVVSTHYGKIYGDPEQMNFRYYLNPTPNSRNIEFDPKQNLLGGLQSFEQVLEP